jgi:glycosyltransferase involved in cell wall biosynthesis
VSVIAAAASGERELARRRLTDGLRAADSRRAQVLLAAAAATGQWSAVESGDGRPPQSPAPARGGAAAYLAYAAGDVAKAERALVGVHSPFARTHRRWLSGERAVLNGSALDVLEPKRASAAPKGGAVLHVVTNSLPEVQAGYTVRTQGIVAGQRAAGIDAHVCTPPGFPVAQGHLAASPLASLSGVPYHRTVSGACRVDRPDRHLESYAAAVGALARSVGASVLHAHSKHVNAQAALVAGRRLGLPVVYEVRGFLEDTWRSRGGRAASDFYRWSRSTETRCMKLADAVVTLSESMREDIVRRDIDPGSVHVVGNCVPDDHLSAPVDRDGVREGLGIGPDDVVVGTVSTLNDYEGIDVLVEAGGILDDPRLAVLVVGDGPARDRLSARAAELTRAGCRTRFVLTGRVPHARSRDYHAALDVFCLPRLSTPVTDLVAPLKPVEAMGLGIPVVGSDLPPVRELLQEERGVILPPADPEALARAVESLVDDAPRRKEIGEQGRAYVAQERTWSTAARAYRQVYEGVA